MVDGVILLVDSRRRRDAADQVRHRQGARAGPASRSSSSTRSTAPTRASRKCSTRCSTCSSASRRTTSSSTSRCSTPRAATAMPATTHDVARGHADAAVREDRRPCAAAGGRPGRPVQVPRHPARPRQFPRPHPDRPGLLGHGQDQQADPRARHRRQGRRDRPRVQDDGLPRARARAGRRGQGGRHHLDRRPHQRDRRQHHRRSRGLRAAPRPADRSADAVDALRGQRFSPMAGPRGRQGHAAA